MVNHAGETSESQVCQQTRVFGNHRPRTRHAETGDARHDLVLAEGRQEKRINGVAVEPVIPQHLSTFPLVVREFRAIGFVDPAQVKLGEHHRHHVEIAGVHLVDAHDPSWL
jgi:hypothetical protein